MLLYTLTPLFNSLSLHPFFFFFYLFLSLILSFNIFLFSTFTTYLFVALLFYFPPFYPSLSSLPLSLSYSSSFYSPSTLLLLPLLIYILLYHCFFSHFVFLSATTLSCFSFLFSLSPPHSCFSLFLFFAVSLFPLLFYILLPFFSPPFPILITSTFFSPFLVSPFYSLSSKFASFSFSIIPYLLPISHFIISISIFAFLAHFFSRFFST